MTKNREISNHLPQLSPREQAQFDQLESNHSGFFPKPLLELYRSGVLDAFKVAIAKYSPRAKTSHLPSSGSHSSNYNT